ncbi:hypothetical protein BC830DRAFT_742605 [Chytriomyces sp. MP71]|nr:hypothetical protein BC830DRAFT_742605 [Chytriomyces sp. MP71]
MHNQSEDLLVSANFGMESMIITSLQRLSENKKRKSTYEAVSRRSSAKRRQEESDSSVRPDIQIPGSKMDSTDDNADRGDEELPFPPFARLATPENFVHSFTGHPVAFHLPSAKKQEPARHIPMVLEDWYLDENGYTKKAKEIANWDDIVEARGPPVPIIKPKPPVPGLTPHSSHHHTHYPAFLEDSDEKL